MELVRIAQRKYKALSRPEPEAEADLYIWFSNKDGWKVEFASSRARRWARSNLNFDHYERSEHVFRTDIAGINSLIQRGSLAGLMAAHMAPRSPFDRTTIRSDG